MSASNSKSSDRSVLDRKRLRSLSEALETHFPQPMEETELVLMEISPHRLHAYWHITPWDLESATLHSQDEETTLILRFHDLTEADAHHQPPPAFDIEIEQTTGSQYVEVWEDSKRYAAELGLRNQDGLLLDLARSNTVELPRAGHSPVSGTRILTLTPLAQELFTEPPDNQAKSPESPTDTKSSWKEEVNQPPDTTLLGSESKLFPLFPDPRQLPEDEQTTEAASQSGLADVSTVEIPPRTTSAREPESKHKSIPPQSINTTPASDPTLVVVRDSVVEPFPSCNVENIQELDRAQVLPMKPSLSLDEAAAQIPADYTIPPVGDTKTHPQQMDMTPGQLSEPDISRSALQPLSSYTLGSTQDENVQVEMIIHGHSRPNSQFVFYGYPIPTLADGSFYLQRNLPASTLKLAAQLLAANHEN